MTFTSSINLKLVLLAALLAVSLAAAVPAGAIVQPRNCGKVTAKGKRWQVKADQIPCSTAKKWAVAYIRSFRTPRYYKCKRAASPSLYRVCTTNHYAKERKFLIFKPR